MPLQTLMEFWPGGFATMHSRQAGLGVTCPVDSGSLHIGAALAGAIVNTVMGVKAMAAAAAAMNILFMILTFLSVRKFGNWINPRVPTLTPHSPNSVRPTFDRRIRTRCLSMRS
jgi:hypothetical protein